MAFTTARAFCKLSCGSLQNGLAPAANIKQFGDRFLKIKSGFGATAIDPPILLLISYGLTIVIQLIKNLY